jgi:hypothetical protein
MAFPNQLLHRDVNYEFLAPQKIDPQYKKLDFRPYEVPGVCVTADWQVPQQQIRWSLAALRRGPKGRDFDRCGSKLYEEPVSCR